MKYTVGKLETPENLNHLSNSNYDLTMKYCISGFERPVLVVEVSDNATIKYMYLDNITENSSVVIDDLIKVKLCDEIMGKYLNKFLS